MSGMVIQILATCIVPDGYRHKISPVNTNTGTTFYKRVRVRIRCFSS